MKKAKPMTDKTAERTDRQGTVCFSAYVDQTTHRAWKVLAAEEGTTSVALMYEAMAHTFTRHGKQPPKPAVDYLKEHDRPVPTPPKGKSKGTDPG